MSTLTFLCQSLQREESAPELTHIVHRRCAWCSTWLGIAPTDASAAGFTTDTICASCFNQVRAQYRPEVAA